MAAPRKYTVGSVSNRGEIIWMGVTRTDNDSLAFKCSCGEIGPHIDKQKDKWPLYAVFLRWAQHVGREHPEYEDLLM